MLQANKACNFVTTKHNYMPPGRPAKQTDEFSPLADEIKKVDRIRRPRPQKTTVTFMLVGNFKKDESGNVRYPPYIINNEAKVWDEETKSTRFARVLNGVKSMWTDEQEKIPQNQVNSNKVEFRFVEGKLVINSLLNPDHVKFLRLRSDFEKCVMPTSNIKIRYTELDTDKKEREDFEKMERRQDAIRKALDSDYEDAISHFKYMGGNMMNSEGNELSEEGFRSAYVKLAEDKTEMFLKSYDNPFVKMFGLVRVGFEKNKLAFVDGQVSWTDTGTFVCQVPLDKHGTVSDYLAQLMLTPDGVELRSRLEQLNK